MSRRMRAHMVAAPVLPHLAGRRRGRVMGVARTAVYVDFEGFVVALTARGVPLMPNGVAVAHRGDALPAVSRDAAASAEPGRVRAGDLTVSWDVVAPAVWNPVVPGVASPARLRERGGALLEELGIGATANPVVLAAAATGLLASATDEGAEALRGLFDAVLRRSPDAAVPAARALVGRGGGLTPEGDDVLAAVAATLVAGRQVAGIDEEEARAWSEALCPSDVAARTTGLSVTLLQLAVYGKVVEPVQRLLDVSREGALRWRGALTRLLRIGHSTGPAYVLGLGAAATLLAPTPQHAVLAATGAPRSRRD